MPKVCPFETPCPTMSNAVILPIIFFQLRYLREFMSLRSVTIFNVEHVRRCILYEWLYSVHHFTYLLRFALLFPSIPSQHYYLLPPMVALAHRVLLWLKYVNPNQLKLKGTKSTHVEPGHWFLFGSFNSLTIWEKLQSYECCSHPSVVP